MFRYLLVCVAGLVLAAPTWADSWADSMFDELSKDFGTVARGPTLNHPFRVTNNTGQTVHISGVRVSCGCVSASAAEQTIEPGKSTHIDARMDTHRFTGHKAVTIFVTFDQPRWEEVRLVVQANGRDDIAVSPESFSLGQARRGSTPTGKVTVTFYGNGQAAITEIERESNYIQPAAKEISRQPGDVTYEVTVAIRSDLPVGKWYSDVWLKTNNPSMPRIRVPLTIDIESALSVSPATVTLGQVKPGAEAERKVIVRGVKPFKITKVQGTDEELTVKDSSTDSKEVHVLTVKLKSAKAGDLDRKLKIVTDLKEEGEVEFEAKAQVIQ